MAGYVPALFEYDKIIMKGMLANFLLDTNFAGIKLGVSESVMEANELVPSSRAANDHFYKFKELTLQFDKPVVFKEALFGFERRLLSRIVFVTNMANYGILLNSISDKYGAPLIHVLDQIFDGKAYEWQQNNIRLELNPGLYDQCFLKYSLTRIIN